MTGPSRAPGDFWIGVHPRAGWGDADPNQIVWASNVEVPLAVGLLRSEESILQQFARNQWPSFTDPTILAIVFQVA